MWQVGRAEFACMFPAQLVFLFLFSCKRDFLMLTTLVPASLSLPVSLSHAICTGMFS